MPLSRIPRRVGDLVDALDVAAAQVDFVATSSGQLTWVAVRQLQQSLSDLDAQLQIADGFAKARPNRTESALQGAGWTGTVQTFEAAVAAYQTAMDDWNTALSAWHDGLPVTRVQSLQPFVENGRSIYRFTATAGLPAGVSNALRTHPTFLAVQAAISTLATG